MRFKTLVLCLLIGFWCFVSGLVLSAEREPVNDVRVLIDISGSMKKNDPENLRVPALRLITQLLPEGARGGVWSFGQWVNMLVPRGEVTKEWKEAAYASAAEINSQGLFTNIEGALENASWDWKEPDANTDRSIILLTDGLVDISKDAAKNIESKKKILRETLAKLNESNVTVYTIALSKEADREFLRQLSASTEGWYEEVESAAQLERVFLKMFEKAVPVETLPMTDNKIQVDESIRELTLLMFRNKDSKALSITMSGGKTIDYRKKPDNVQWRHEERYDLVTIDKPVAGEWTIDAELDPDNRVMVVADLKVSASRMPNLMLQADVKPYYLELVQQGEVIRKPEFLDLINVTLSRKLGSETINSFTLNDDGEAGDKRAHDGRFSARLDDKPEPGEYQYHMLVDGTTFKRVKRYSVKVVDKPVAVSMKKVSPGNYSLTLTPYSELIKTDSVLIDATVIKEDGSSEGVDIPRTGPNEWRLDVKVEDGQHYDVKVMVQADRANGSSAEFDLGQYRLDGSIPEHSSEVEPAVKPEVKEPEHEAEGLDDQADELKLESNEEMLDEDVEEGNAADEMHEGDEVVDGEQDDSSMLWTILKIVGFNGVLIVGGYFVYRKWFRSPAKEEGDDEGEDDAGDEKEKD